MTGQEIKEILRKNGVNLSELAEMLGISSQTLNSRLNAKYFKESYMEDINAALGKTIFPVGDNFSTGRGEIPVYNVRICAGNGIGVGDEEPAEYISIPRLKGCVGGYVYGDSMKGMFNSGDLILMREIHDMSLLDYGRPYVLNIQELGAVVKLIYSSRKDNHIRLVAYNQDTFANGDRMYPDMDIHINNIRNWFRVVERHETIA